MDKMGYMGQEALAVLQQQPQQQLLVLGREVQVTVLMADVETMD